MLFADVISDVKYQEEIYMEAFVKKKKALQVTILLRKSHWIRVKNSQEECEYLFILPRLSIVLKS